MNLEKREATLIAKCSIADCGRIIHARKWCKRHYQQWSRTGNPIPNIIISDDVKRFWSKVNKTSSCWLWTGLLRPDGYARFSVRGTPVYAHRFSAELNGLQLSPMLVLDHLCRVRNCVNPKHLEQTTQKENVRRGDAGRYNSDKTRCRNGHDFTPDNTYSINNHRACRTCLRANQRAYCLRKQRMFV